MTDQKTAVVPAPPKILPHEVPDFKDEAQAVSWLCDTRGWRPRGIRGSARCLYTPPGVPVSAATETRLKVYMRTNDGKLRRQLNPQTLEPVEQTCITCPSPPVTADEAVRREMEMAESYLRNKDRDDLRSREEAAADTPLAISEAKSYFHEVRTAAANGNSYRPPVMGKVNG